MFTSLDGAVADAKKRLGVNAEPGRHFKTVAHGSGKFSWHACYVDGKPFADEDEAIYIASLTARGHKRNVELIGRAGDRIIIHHKKIRDANGDNIHRATARRLLRMIAAEQEEADKSAELLRKKAQNKEKLKRALASFGEASREKKKEKTRETQRRLEQIEMSLGPMPKTQQSLFEFMPVKFAEAARQDRYESESSVIRLAMRSGGATDKELNKTARELGLVEAGAKRISFGRRLGNLGKKYGFSVEVKKAGSRNVFIAMPGPACSIR